MSNRRRWILSAIMLSAAIAGAQSRKPAPDLTLTDSKGASLQLSQYRGKVVLLNFWATWCHGCKEEMPWYMEFADKYKKNGLAVIGVAMDDDGWQSVKPFIEAKKVNYPIVVGNENLARQYGGVEEMPVTFLIDRHGNIATSHTGMVDKDACESQIRTLLQEP